MMPDRGPRRALVGGQSGHRRRSHEWPGLAALSPLQAGAQYRHRPPGTDDSQVLARTSDDHGTTWSEPIDLTGVSRDFDDPKWRCSVVGPGG